jgi:hypothetical protein
MIKFVIETELNSSKLDIQAIAQEYNCIGSNERIETDTAEFAFKKPADAVVFRNRLTALGISARAI